MTAGCWRCGSTKTEQIKVWIQTLDMPWPGYRQECRHLLACISGKFETTRDQLKDDYEAKP